MLFVNIGDALFSGLLKVWPEAAAWTKMCHVAPEHFHGGAFNGNSCKVLLEKTDLLQSLCPLDAEPFVQAFRDFKDVVEASIEGDNCACFNVFVVNYVMLNFQCPINSNFNAM